jgi:hypothetical protein
MEFGGERWVLVLVLDFDGERNGAGFLLSPFLSLSLWHCLALVAGWLVASLRCCLLAR